MARLRPLPPEEMDDETRDLVESLGGLHLFGTLAHHPALLRKWLVFGGHVLLRSTLPARDRELAILRVGWRCGSPYEFGQHTEIGRRAGLSDEEIRRTTEGPDAPGWSPEDAALLRAVDELVDDHRVGDASWEALTARFTTQQVLDLVFAVGQYVLTCMALNSLEVELDEGIVGFPA